MNDTSQDQNQGQANANQPAPAESIRYSRRGRVLRGERPYSGWVAGLVLILVGVLFLGQTLGTFYLNNWWALFILLPAVGAFAAAWRAAQEAGGRLTGSARASLLGGFVLVCVSAVFLFNLNWAIFGPALIILVGVGILISGFLPKSGNS